MDVWPQFYQQTIDRAIFENEDVIDAFQGGKQRSSSVLIQDRAPFPFQSLYGSIRVEPYNENISLRPRILKVSNVAYMKNVKTSVCKDNLGT